MFSRYLIEISHNHVFRYLDTSIDSSQSCLQLSRYIQRDISQSCLQLSRYIQRDISQSCFFRYLAICRPLSPLARSTTGEARRVSALPFFCCFSSSFLSLGVSILPLFFCIFFLSFFTLILDPLLVFHPSIIICLILRHKPMIYRQFLNISKLCIF